MKTSKRVLIVTYYWPPAGGISPLRCLKIVKYLRDFGWEPIVFTAKNAHYPYLDENNFKDVPEGVEVIRFPIIEPFKLFKFFSGRKKTDTLNNIFHVRDKKEGLVDKLGKWIRANFFIPDARSLWINPSAKFLVKYLKNNPVDAVFSDGPPHTNTMIAYHLKKKLGIPWLSDYQDPWTQVDYYQVLPISKWADSIHRKMEQNCLKAADLISIASPTWGKELEDIGASKTETLYYGYDEADFENLKQDLDSKFTVSHSGLMGYDRCPHPLFPALQALCNEIETFSNDLEIHLFGQVDYSVKEAFEKAGLEKNLKLRGTVNRMESLQAMLNSQMLLLPLNQAHNAKGRIPGKLYENLRAGRPILCLGPLDADVAHILNETNAGKTFSYQDAEGVKAFIRDAYMQYKSGILKNHEADVFAYSNKMQTKKVAEMLNQITQ